MSTREEGSETEREDVHRGWSFKNDSQRASNTTKIAKIVSNGSYKRGKKSRRKGRLTIHHRARQQRR